MKFLALGLLILNLAYAQDDCNCQSQLIRVDVEGSALNSILTSNNNLKDIALPSIETFLNSDVFKKNVLKDYPMQSMGFPFNSKGCETEKAQGNPKLRNVDCKNPMFCSDPVVSEEVKSEFCVGLPCSMILGSQNMSQCYDKATARPALIHYPQPVSVKKLEMKPKNIVAENDTFRACFDVSELEVGVGVEVEFNRDPQVRYDNMGVDDLLIKLDGKREICMSAKLALGSSEPLTDIKIEKSDTNFVSDAMIGQAVQGATVRGLSGYSPATINVLKLTAVPPLARYFRSSLEEAVQAALATTFQTQISGYYQMAAGKSGPTQVSTPTNSFISEMGVGNMMVKKYVDLMECSLLKSEKKPIPASHSCLTQAYPFKKNPLKLKDIPNLDSATRLLSEAMTNNDQVTSESLRSRLAEFESRMPAALFQSKIRPIIDKISNQQMESNVVTGVQIFSTLGDKNSMNGFGLSLTGLCDVINPSSHADRSIPNCPVQAYVDLDELNKLMTAMYKTGRLCHSGKGDYTPELDNRGQPVRNGDGSPRGTGCLFRIEEDQDGMRCYLNGAPQLRFDQKSGGYKVQLNTKECFRGAVALGQGKVAGDINFEIGYKPNICENGDFCLEDGEAEWTVVPGTARYALSESSWLNGIVRRTVDKKLNEIIGQTIRVPLSASTGPMSMIPLEAEGRIDKGPGFFGACLKGK